MRYYTLAVRDEYRSGQPEMFLAHVMRARNVAVVCDPKIKYTIRRDD